MTENLWQPKPKQEKKVEKKYKQTRKLTVGNILKALEKETCYEAKTYFTDYVIWVMRDGYTKIHLYLEKDLSPSSFEWALKSTKRINWLLKHGFIKEVRDTLVYEDSVFYHDSGQMVKDWHFVKHLESYYLVNNELEKVGKNHTIKNFPVEIDLLIYGSREYYTKRK